MNWARNVWFEFVGLFVDDGRFAVAVLGWLALTWLVLPRLRLPHPVPPVLLFAGLAAILAESVWRRFRER